VIRKVIRGNNVGRTVNYLFGPGKRNEHTNPHLITAWDTAWLDDPTLSASLTTTKGRARLIAALDAPRILHEVEVPGGHVYHVPLSIPAEDGLLGDKRWRQVVEEAIDHLGFGPDTEGRGGCRWIAVHHGLSINGNDHVHVVVQLVRGDGRIANLYRDWPKWDAVCQAAEERWNLTRTRRAGAGERPLSRAEVERANRTGRDPARRELARRVRAAATATSSELEFLADLRQSGVLIQPRLSGEQVVGYRVASATEGTDPLWLSGSQLHRDLSLPKLRARWDKLDSRWDHYVAQVWRGELDLDSMPQLGPGLGWSRAARMLAVATEEVQQLPPDDNDAWTQIVGQAADLVAILGRRLESESGPLSLAGRHLARAAQPDRGQPRPPVQSHNGGRPLLVEVARLVAHSRDPAQAAITVAVVLLAYGLVRLLDHLAAQRGAQAAVRRQLELASDRLAEHPYVTTYPGSQLVGRERTPRRLPLADVPYRQAKNVNPRHQHGASRTR
jgi:hypothetical protein